MQARAAEDDHNGQYAVEEQGGVRIRDGGRYEQPRTAGQD